MKTLLLLSTLFLCSFNLTLAQQPDPSIELQKSLDQDVADGQFAGVVVGLSVGEKELVVTAGNRDVATETPYERLTLNRIASIAKSMTAVATLKLYEQGKLDLDAPISTYLPNYPKRHATRITTEEYMEEHVWAVAGMDNTGVEHLTDRHENKSSFYKRSKKGKIKLSKTNNLTNRIPGGGILSTADDLLKFGKAILNNTFINEATTKMMWEKPGLAYDGNPYGMGWFLYGKNPKLGEMYGHTGGQTGCSSVLLLAPEKDAVMIVLSNTALTGQHVFGIAVKELFPIAESIYSDKEGQ